MGICEACAKLLKMGVVQLVATGRILHLHSGALQCRWVLTRYTSTSSVRICPTIPTRDMNNPQRPPNRARTPICTGKREASSKRIYTLFRQYDVTMGVQLAEHVLLYAHVCETTSFSVVPRCNIPNGCGSPGCTPRCTSNELSTGGYRMIKRQEVCSDGARGIVL